MKYENGSTTRILTAATYIYMVLPFIIFAVGWFRIRFWVPAVTIVIFCTWKAWKETDSFWRPCLTRDHMIKILFLCAVLAAWVYYSGIGGKVFQNSDHPARNGIFEVLVKYKWPVYNTDINTEIYPEGTRTSLIYYIGFWMPAAVVGKLFGIQAGYTFQMVWAFLGLFLVYYHICARKKKLLVWPLALLIFFSGLDIAGLYLTGTDLFSLKNDAHIEWWAVSYQYSSMTSQLFWVYNQTLPAWLCTVFAMQQKNNRSIVLILASVMLSSTFPFIGLLVFAAFWMLTRKYEVHQDDVTSKKIKSWLELFAKDTFTVQNVLGAGILGIFTFLYLKGNISASEISSQGAVSVFSYIEWTEYLVFVFLEAGIYLVLVYQYKKDHGTYFIVLLSLVFIPLLKGKSGDYCMRVSIPALFILMLFVQDVLEEAVKKGDKVIAGCLVAALCIGSVTPIHEITRTIQHTIEENHKKVNQEEDGQEGNSPGKIISRTSQEILNAKNFSGRMEDNLFFEYIIKKFSGQEMENGY